MAKKKAIFHICKSTHINILDFCEQKKINGKTYYFLKKPIKIQIPFYVLRNIIQQMNKDEKGGFLLAKLIEGELKVIEFYKIPNRDIYGRDFGDSPPKIKPGESTYLLDRKSRDFKLVVEKFEELSDNILLSIHTHVLISGAITKDPILARKLYNDSKMPSTSDENICLTILLNNNRFIIPEILMTWFSVTNDECEGVLIFYGEGLCGITQAEPIEKDKDVIAIIN
jgi:hypothetical protein